MEATDDFLLAVNEECGLGGVTVIGSSMDERIPVVSSSLLVEAAIRSFLTADENRLSVLVLCRLAADAISSFNLAPLSRNNISLDFCFGSEAHWH